MAEQNKKVGQKVKCEVCEKELCKTSLNTHMKTQHKNEEISKKKNESNKKTEESVKSTDDVDNHEEDVNKDSPQKSDEEPQPEKTNVVHDLINLDTKEIENLLEREEEFLDAVENLENDLGLEVDLTINESMLAYIQDDKNYRSDFARTMELEESDNSRNEKIKLEKELINAKKTILFLRKLSLKDKKYIKTLEEECTNGAKEYRSISKRYKNSIQIKKKLDECLKSNRELLAKTSSENIEVKQKLETKQAVETATKDHDMEDLVVIEISRNELACEKCDFVAKSNEELIGHNKFIHVDCHVCRKHCDTVMELNSHIEHVHNLKPFDCAWCKLSFPHHNKFEVHRREKHEVSHHYQCDKCPSKFQKREQMLNHIMKEHVIKCIFKECGLITDTEAAMIKHLDDKHLINAPSENAESDNKSKQKECRHFKNGKCFKGNQCKFEHIESSHQCQKCGYNANTRESLETHIKFKHENENKSTKPCRNGEQCIHKAQNRCKFLHRETPNKKQTNNKTNQKCKRGENCTFKARGTCFYYHDGVGVQARKESDNIKSTKSDLWCKYQDKCSSSECKFKHFESNFPQIPAPRQKPTLAEWLHKN